MIVFNTFLQLREENVLRTNFISVNVYIKIMFETYFDFYRKNFEKFHAFQGYLIKTLNF